MYNFDSLMSDAKKMGIDMNGTLLIHSSMKAIGETDGGADTVLNVWSEYMKNGLLVLPSHTWKTVKPESPVYDVKNSPSCVGILTNVFRSRPNVKRSLHPTHSVAALGGAAEAFTSSEEYSDSPCPKNGCWGKLYDYDATILFLGCKLNRNTFIHFVEELNNVPDRIDAGTVKLSIIKEDGSECHTNMHRHQCSFTDDISENYIKLEKIFFDLGAIRYAKFGDADCIIANARKMSDITGVLLQNHDIQLFANMEPIPEEWYK